MSVAAVAPVPGPESDPKAAVRENEKKWGKPLMDAGWTCIPSTIILRQQALGLDLDLPTHDFWALLHTDPEELTQELSTQGNAE